MTFPTPDTGLPACNQVPDLPVAQIKLSHDLSIDADMIPAHGASAVIPPYQAMAEDDELTFIWQGYYQGTPEPEWKHVAKVSVTQLGHPLVVLIPRVEVLIVDDGEAEISYSLQRASGGPVQPSPVQTFRIVPPTSTLLETPSVAGHTPGQPLDPADWPDGIVVRISAWPGMQVDDYAVLYADGLASDTSLVDAMLVDASHVQAGQIEFSIDQGWLSANEGGTVTLAYQFARPGAGKSGAPLSLDIHEALPLPPPIVERASAEGDASQYHGFLPAQNAVNGVFISVPASVPLVSGEPLSMHWHGHPAGGQYVAPVPISSEDERRFFIPPSAVAANMGVGETKRFGVFYQVRSVRNSIPFGLRIVPLEQARYPVIQWHRLMGATTLSLQTVAADGEVLSLASWPFMARGQRVTFQASGVLASGAAGQIVVRDAAPVTEQEASSGRVTGQLPRAFLQGLKINEYITLTAALSFDGGETQVQLPSNSGVRLIP